MRCSCASSGAREFASAGAWARVSEDVADGNRSCAQTVVGERGGQPIGPRNRDRCAVPSGLRSVDWEFIASSAGRWISITGMLVVVWQASVAKEAGDYSRKSGDATAVQAIRAIAQASLLGRQLEVDASARKRGRCREDTCIQPLRPRSEERTLTGPLHQPLHGVASVSIRCTRLAGAARPNVFGAVRPSTMPAFVVASARRTQLLAQNTFGCVFTHTAKHAKCDFKSGM